MSSGVKKHTENIMKIGNGKSSNESMGIEIEPYFLQKTG